MANFLRSSRESSKNKMKLRYSTDAQSWEVYTFIAGTIPAIWKWFAIDENQANWYRVEMQLMIVEFDPATDCSHYAGAWTENPIGESYLLGWRAYQRLIADYNREIRNSGYKKNYMVEYIWEQILMYEESILDEIRNRGAQHG